MKQHDVLSRVTLLGLLLLFIYGAWDMLRLRADFGDAYAPYSSYRPDTFGTLAVFEALQSLPEYSVRRNELPFVNFQGDASTALLIVGVTESPDSPRDIRAIERFMTEGGRVVVLYGLNGRYNADVLSPAEAEAIGPETSPSAEERIRRYINSDEVPAVTPPTITDWGDGYVMASERWGFRVVNPRDWEAVKKPVFSEKVADHTVNVVNLADKPGALRWKTAEYLIPLVSEWSPLYTFPKGEVAMMERNFGRGSLIVGTSTYLLSNEAQRVAPQGQFLARLLAGKTDIVFDEYSKGIDRTPGVVGLMKKMRLHLLMATAVILALLYVWRATVSLVPRRTEEQERERALVLAGRDGHDGLASLLRSAIPTHAVLTHCVNEWEHIHARTDPNAKTKLAQARQLLQEASVTPTFQQGETLLRTYKALAAALHDRRRKP